MARAPGPGQSRPCALSEKPCSEVGPCGVAVWACQACAVSLPPLGHPTVPGTRVADSLVESVLAEPSAEE